MCCATRIKTLASEGKCSQCFKPIFVNKEVEEVVLASNYLPEERHITCFDCVELRKSVLDYFPRDPFCEDELDVYRTFPPNSLVYVLRRLCVSACRKPHNLPDIAIRDFFKRLFKYEPKGTKRSQDTEKAYSRTPQQSEQDFAPAKTKQEIALKTALEDLGYRVVHSELFHRFYPDIRFEDYPYIVEVDGGYHQEIAQRKKDEARTFYLNKHGYSVIRVSNDLVDRDLPLVLKEIENIIIFTPKCNYSANKNLG